MGMGNQFRVALILFHCIHYVGQLLYKGKGKALIVERRYIVAANFLVHLVCTYL